MQKSKPVHLLVIHVPNGTEEVPRHWNSRNWLWWRLEALVVVAGLEEVNPLVSNEVHEPVFLRDTARPGAWRQVLERFGLSNSREGIA